MSTFPTTLPVTLGRGDRPDAGLAERALVALAERMTERAAVVAALTVRAEYSEHVRRQREARLLGEAIPRVLGEGAHIEVTWWGADPVTPAYLGPDLVPYALVDGLWFAAAPGHRLYVGAAARGRSPQAATWHRDRDGRLVCVHDLAEVGAFVAAVQAAGDDGEAA